MGLGKFLFPFFLERMNHSPTNPFDSMVIVKTFSRNWLFEGFSRAESQGKKCGEWRGVHPITSSCYFVRGCTLYRRNELLKGETCRFPATVLLTHFWDFIYERHTIKPSASQILDEAKLVYRRNRHGFLVSNLRMCLHGFIRTTQSDRTQNITTQIAA